MKPIKICEKCGELAYWNTYFYAYMCSKCENMERYKRPDDVPDYIIEKSLKKVMNLDCECIPLNSMKGKILI